MALPLPTTATPARSTRETAIISFCRGAVPARCHAHGRQHDGSGRAPIVLKKEVMDLLFPFPFNLPIPRKPGAVFMKDG